MFGKAEIEFKAQIKLGASIGQDWHYFRWPDCKAPKSEGGGDQAKAHDMVFTARLMGNYFDLKAMGYGEQPDYGNGSIHLYDFSQLIVSDEDRKRVIDHFQAKKQKEIDKVMGDLGKLQGELSSLSNGER